VAADQEFVLLRSLPADIWSKEDDAKAARRYRRVVIHRFGVSDGSADRQVAAMLDTLRRRLPRSASQEDVLRAFAIKRPYDAGMSDVSGSFAEFLTTKSIDAKREALTRVLGPTRQDVIEQFALVPLYLEGLDQLARGLIASGYPAAASVVFESLANEAAP